MQTVSIGDVKTCFLEKNYFNMSSAELAQIMISMLSVKAPFKIVAGDIL